MMDVCRAHVLAALLLLGAPAAAFAQAEEARGMTRPLFVVGALYDARTRMSAEGGVFIPFRSYVLADEGAVDGRCLSVTASAGPGGHRFTAGPALQLWNGSGHAIYIGMDAAATVLRTSHAPRGARPDMTYVGVEGGLTLLSLRLGIGVAHGVSGPGPHDTVFSWNVGIRTVW